MNFSATLARPGVRSLGIDVGGTSVKLVALDGTRTLWTGQSGFYLRPSAGELRDALRDAAGGRVAEFAPSAVGLCVPGLFDETGRRITVAVNVPGLVGLPLDDFPGAVFDAKLSPPLIFNDAVVAAIDLQTSRKLTGRLLTLAIGTGVGSAVLDNGVPLLVEGNSPGHLGQCDVSLDDDAPIGADGGAGGLEAYVGATALKRRFGPDLTTALDTLPKTDPVLRALARIIRIGHALYRPNHVCLLGGIGVRLASRLELLREMIEKNLTSLARSGWTLSCGDHDFHAARGAARMAQAGQ